MALNRGNICDFFYFEHSNTLTIGKERNSAPATQKMCSFMFEITFFMTFSLSNGTKKKKT